MCGVVGMLHCGKNNEISSEGLVHSLPLLFIHMLINSQPRGEDATGMALVTNEGSLAVLKMAEKPSVFISRIDEEGKDVRNFVSIWRNSYTHETDYPRIVIGHCRKATIGSVANKNNHPIIRESAAVIVHNGTLKNHNELVPLTERDGDVDSEVLCILMNRESENGKKLLDKNMPLSVANKVEGAMAFLYANRFNPYQVAFARRERTLCFMYLKKLHILLIASEMEFIKSALNITTAFATVNYGKEIGDMFKDTDERTVIERTAGILNLARESNDIDSIIEKVDIPYSSYSYNNSTTVYYGAKTYQAGSNVGNTTQTTAVVTTGTAITNANNITSDKSTAVENSMIYCNTLDRFIRFGDRDKKK